MDLQLWNEASAIFAEAVEIEDPRRRIEFVARRCTDSIVHAEVNSLLSHWVGSEALETPALDVAAPVQAGTIVGPYRIVREIGRGGMGVVFEANRADGQFERRVALKFIGGPMLADLLKRFQLERRILATLEHPHITRLHDAGVMPSGIPYLVMDYVEGQPITEYCRSRGLPIRERLLLFRKVCSAVHHAHQRLIIHRDLKPANILVDESGEPRLLDFGISRLLEDRPGDATIGAARFTLNFASPEQIRGEPLSTASDIYSLGVILYCLLTECNPYDLTTESLVEAIRIISTPNVKRPSEVVVAGQARLLRGDLDAIVSKAMNPDANGRYGSAEEFAQDLERYLNGRPVIACPPSWLYRTQKFLRSHALTVSAVSMAVLLFMGTTGVALYQKRRVEQERERTIAQLNAVRELSKSLLYDFQPALAAIPGTLDVRQKMIGKAKDYLQRLTAEANVTRTEANGIAVRLDLMKAWWELAKVQGGIDWGLGDAKGAMSSYQQAQSQARTIQDSEPNHEQAARSLLLLTTEMAVHAFKAGWADESKKLKLEYRAQLAQLLRRYPHDEEFQTVAATDFFNRGLEVIAGDRQKALEFWQQSLQGFEELLKLKPEDDKRIYNVALLDKRVAATLAGSGRLDEAVPLVRRAQELERRQLDRNPKDAKLRLNYTFTLSTLASIYIEKNEVTKGLDLFDEVIKVRRELWQEEPANSRLRSSLTGGLVVYGENLLKNGDLRKAGPAFQESLRLLNAKSSDPFEKQTLKRATNGLAAVERKPQSK